MTHEPGNRHSQQAEEEQGAGVKEGVGLTAAPVIMGGREALTSSMPRVWHWSSSFRLMWITEVVPMA